MIHEVDSALRSLIEREATGTRDVEIVFDAPTREWAGRRNSPTIDVYLYDIREDMRRRERGMHNVYDERKIIVSRHLPPRHFKLSYLVTAWTQRPEDEHRLLSSLLTCFLRYDALPRNVLTGPLTELGLPIPITIALPPPEDRAFADVWSALGGELKPSIDLVVIVPMDTGQQFHTGPPVAVPPVIDLGGSGGWPTREAKSGLNGYQTAASWQSEQGRLVLAGGLPPRDAADDVDGGDTGEDGAAQGGGRRRGRGKTGGSEVHSGQAADRDDAGSTGGSGSSREASQAAAPTSASGSGETRQSSWEIATGWADGVALGPAASPPGSEPSPGSAGSSSGAGSAAGSATGSSTRAGSAAKSGTGSGAGTGSSPRAGSGTRAGPGTGGRPGPRVAMTRVRQTKKKS